MANCDDSRIQHAEPRRDQVGDVRMVAGAEPRHATRGQSPAPPGLDVPHVDLGELPEHRLYRSLVESGDLDPYSAYNASIRRLVSFESSFEQR